MSECLTTNKGDGVICPQGKSHRCRYGDAEHTGNHQCGCGFEWPGLKTARPVDIGERTGVTDMLLGIAGCPFEPTLDWLVIVMEESAGMKGTLYIPDTAKDASQVGQVIACGPGLFAMNEAGEAYCTSPMMFKEGDRVLFAKYSGADVDWKDDQKYLFVKQSDIICKVK